MATPFPGKPELTGVPLSKGAFRAGLDKLLDAVTGLLGTDGTAAAARTGLGVLSADEIRAQISGFGLAGGTVDAVTLSLVPAVTSLAAGLSVSFKASGANGLAVTLDLDGLGAKPVRKQGGLVELAAGDIRAGQIVEVEYDGTDWQMQSQLGNTLSASQLAFVGEVRSIYGGVTRIPVGWEALDGATLGSASSPAGKANDGYLALYKLLWEEDPNLVVSTGRGATAQADWDADKTIALPDLAGRSPVAVGQGNTGEGGGLGTLRTIGDLGGAETHALTEPEMPSHTHDYQNEPPLAGGAGSSDTFNDFVHNIVATTSAGGDQPHNNMHPFFVATFVIYSGVGI